MNTESNTEVAVASLKLSGQKSMVVASLYSCRESNGYSVQSDGWRALVVPTEFLDLLSEGDSPVSKTDVTNGRELDLANNPTAYADQIGLEFDTTQDQYDDFELWLADGESKLGALFGRCELLPNEVTSLVSMCGDVEQAAKMALSAGQGMANTRFTGKPVFFGLCIHWDN